MVLKLARLLSQHAEACAAVRVEDEVRVYEVRVRDGRISIQVLEGEQFDGTPLEFSILDLADEDVHIFSRAYGAWLKMQAKLYGLPGILWE